MARTAIVTGASSGIGRHCAIALSKAGWNIVLTARRMAGLKETAALCPNETLILAGDITDEPFVKGIFDATVAHFGHLDLLFNNAGVSAKQVPIETMSLETFQTGGRIINNGSLSAHVPRPHSFPYTCSKHAITGLSRCTALDGRPFNITCTQIDIGNAHTDMAARHTIGAMQPDGTVVPEATFDVEHVASTIVHIASLPPDVAMLEVNIMAAGAPYVGRG